MKDSVLFATLLSLKKPRTDREWMREDKWKSWVGLDSPASVLNLAANRHC